jgi:hypothetical protein
MRERAEQRDERPSPERADGRQDASLPMDYGEWWRRRKWHGNQPHGYVSHCGYANSNYHYGRNLLPYLRTSSLLYQSWELLALWKHILGINKHIGGHEYR